jgi:hypothetical protein
VGRGAVAVDPTAAALLLRSGDEGSLELSSPDATSSFADPSVEAAASTAAGARRSGAGGTRRRGARRSGASGLFFRPQLLGRAGGAKLEVGRRPADLRQRPLSLQRTDLRQCSGASTSVRRANLRRQARTAAGGSTSSSTTTTSPGPNRGWARHVTNNPGRPIHIKSFNQIRCCRTNNGPRKHPGVTI